MAGVPEGDVDQDGDSNISDVTCLVDYLLSGSWPDNPVSPPVEGDWVDLGLPSGTLWATRNVGASAPEDYGDYFAWGETEQKDYYYYNWSHYKWCNGSSISLTKYCTDSNHGYNGFVDNKTELDLEDDAAYVNWGASWRMPTNEQLQELINMYICNRMWTTQNGVGGYLITGPNGNTLFLPAAGYFTDISGNADWEGSFAGYWSRTLSDDTNSACCAGLGWWTGVDKTFQRDFGFTVRAVRVSQN
ncbi:MAG: hypothetical protein IKH53_02965 [Muribaculaceae bacterium]|nr:hypothetical protein [Muribaculaceae bacterium]